MHLRNELLFSNAFLNEIAPDPDQLGAIYAFMHGVRAWFQRADLSSNASMLSSFIRPLLQNQSLDLTPIESQPSAYILAAPWDANNPQGLLFVVPPDQPLDGVLPDGRIPKGQHWMVKAVDCARDLHIRWVVLTNARHWRILDAQGLRRYEAYLEIDLESLVQSANPGREYNLAAHLFHSLFSLEKGFLHDPETGLCGLDQFVAGSLHYTQRTEQYLKYSVCDNLNVPGGGDGIIAQLCLGLVRAINPGGDYSFTAAERDTIYRDATYLLYRLLFVFYAEARGLLPSLEPAYAEISLRQIIDDAVDLHANPDRAALRPTSLWDALLSLFNRIDVGDIALHVPAFDGGLFENSQRPYLNKYSIQNPFLADALVQLAYIKELRQPEKMERIDYRDLSVRHLGSLYEGMIEYRLFIAEEDLLARREKDGGIRYIPQKDTSRKPNDELIPVGQVYFAQSPHERKSTGTHYTLEDLVERLVRQTVLRLLDERWQAYENEFNSLLKELHAASPDRRPALQEFIDQSLLKFIQDQVLSLHVCDPAMGSGHFLVHTSHQIANFIIHTLARADWSNPGIDLDPSSWRRLVVERCLYGVDINPMAVELAKLSLWLVSMQTDHPLSFLDHHLKHGNSLLGSRLQEIESLLNENEFQRVTTRTAVAEERGQYAFRELLPVLETLSKATTLMGKIAAKVVSQVADVHQQALDYADVEAILAPYKRIGDLLVARKMGLKASLNELGLIARAIESGTLSQLSPEYHAIIHNAEDLLVGHNTIHWELEFPRIFGDSEMSGFDIILGNPPFLGGSKISSEVGNQFLSYLKIAFSVAEPQADLCAYFFRLAFSLIKFNCYFGMVSTNTISQGDTRRIGLAYIIQNFGIISFADRFVKWAGDATVEVNVIVIKKTDRQDITPVLDERITPYISSWLDDLPEIEPNKLSQNSHKAFLGDSIKGKGFLLSQDEYKKLVDRNPINLDCLLPFPNGIDLNNSPDQNPSRYVICFQDWSLEKAALYPDLLKIVEERVKSQREKTRNDVPIQVKRKKFWWIFGSPATELYKHAEKFNKVLARSRVSELHTLTFLPNAMRFGDSLAVFIFDDYFNFGLLQSWIHEVWLRRQASTMRTDVRYTISDCFLTFPFPQAPSANSISLAERTGQSFYEHRQQIMLARQLGLTKLYNLFNNLACQDADVVEMRRLHAAMDSSVLACYGWQDIDLQHAFYPNDRKKIRFTPSPAAQREIFIRLMALNQKIAAEEAAQGLAVASSNEDELEEE